MTAAGLMPRAAVRTWGGAWRVRGCQAVFRAVFRAAEDGDAGVAEHREQLVAVGVISGHVSRK
jgi:hypothetical protein